MLETVLSKIYHKPMPKKYLQLSEKTKYIYKKKQSKLREVENKLKN